ncbi:MAG: bestrophin family ion channel [Myxococcota bacterium]|nr:bestrophin family ion channel [Myxococcota bacterium]
MFLNTADKPYKGSILFMMFGWQTKTSLLCILSGVVIAALHSQNMLNGTIFPDFAKLPTFPLAVLGGALGIFVSFRTNSAYQRWWEGRKLWGRLINTSRHLCSQAIAYLKPEQAREVVLRQVAYVHVLRCGLRDQDSFKDEDVRKAMQEEEQNILPGSTNLNHALLNRQMKLFVEQKNAGVINDFIMQSFDESVRHLLDIQGGCERIKKTPFPPGYGFLATRLTQILSVALPFFMVDKLGWWVILVNLIICMAFQLINEVGRVLENPFTTFWPALPLSAMAKTIERNLRQALGESELPSPHAATKEAPGMVLM